MRFKRSLWDLLFILEDSLAFSPSKKSSQVEKWGNPSMPFSDRKEVVICEEMETDKDYADLYRTIQEHVKAKNFHLCKQSDFTDELDTFGEHVRYGCLRAGSKCVLAIQELLKRNIPIILAGKDEDIAQVLGCINVALSEGRGGTKMEAQHLHKLIFEVKDTTKIDGAIHWAEEFYPYLYDNIMSKQAMEKRNVDNMADSLYRSEKEREQE